jgi:uncharacterized secreted protein with C-terminal beta-propeller domain
MSKAMKRSIKTSQIGLRQMHISLTATATTPVAAGPDKFEVASITDLGVGNFLVILRNPAANSKDIFVLGTSGPADTAVAVTAVAYDRVTVQVTDLANIAKDEDFSMALAVHDARYEV